MKVYCIDTDDLYNLNRNSWYNAIVRANDLYSIVGIGLVPCNKFITEDEFKKTKREEKINTVIS